MLYFGWLCETEDSFPRLLRCLSLTPKVRRGPEALDPLALMATRFKPGAPGRPMLRPVARPSSDSVPAGKFFRARAAARSQFNLRPTTLKRKPTNTCITGAGQDGVAITAGGHEAETGAVCACISTAPEGDLNIPRNARPTHLPNQRILFQRRI